MIVKPRINSNNKENLPLKNYPKTITHHQENTSKIQMNTTKDNSQEYRIKYI